MHARCGHVCEACQSAPSEDVDHILPRSMGGGNKMENLQGLCCECHRDKTRGDIQRLNNTKVFVVSNNTFRYVAMSGRFLYFDMENGDRLAVLQSLVSGDTITAAPSTIFEVSGAEGTKTKTAEQLAEKYSSVELTQ